MAKTEKIKEGVGKGTPGPGRPKGLPNKNTTLLKDAALRAATLAGGGDVDGREGLVEYLKDQAIKNPGPFLALLGKLLPLQVSGDPDNPIRHKIEHDAERFTSAIASLATRAREDKGA